jgi:hypothetical protein
LSLANANHNQTNYNYGKLSRRSSRIDALSKSDSHV